MSISHQNDPEFNVDTYPPPSSPSFINTLLLSMSSFELQLYQVEIQLGLDALRCQVEDILDNLFFMRVELEAGQIPVFPPEPAFDPMSTIRDASSHSSWSHVCHFIFIFNDVFVSHCFLLHKNSRLSQHRLSLYLKFCNINQIKFICLQLVSSKKI
jgi:hypothetical protein